MRLDPNEKLGGFPVLFVRKVVRSLNCRMLWDVGSVQKAAGVDLQDAARLIKALVRARLAKANRGRDANTWTTTQLARRFGAATAAKPISRETAERALQKFLTRVADVNRRSYFLAKVTKVVVFGSYLRPEVDHLGDVDIAVVLRPRQKDRERLRKATIGRLNELEDQGQIITDVLERAAWWHVETFRFLKGRSRAISLHDDAVEKELVDAVPHKVIFTAAEEERQLAKLPPVDAPAIRIRRIRDCPF